MDTKRKRSTVAPAGRAYPQGIEIRGGHTPEYQTILSAPALDFVAGLQRRFCVTRAELLQARRERQRQINQGAPLNFMAETESVRNADWQVAASPPDLQNRRVEITGPVDRKMMINAFNSGASTFMADFEDSLSPTWDNVLQGQMNLVDAVRRSISFTNPDGKEYHLNERIATLLVRPRGWHLNEKHVLVDGQPISASLFDFGLYFFHNAHELLKRGTGPYFYLPKLESHREARLWNDVFIAAQAALGLPRGTIRATVLVETILAAFEMEEILYELREHSAGLNAGRWDYIFSVIKKLGGRSSFSLPDRSQIGMTVPFMRAYTELLVKTCHQRGAHAIGGMAAYIPSRRDIDVNTTALEKVREDKLRESNDGFDGTWVAHPDLVPVAREVFDRVLGDKPDQKERLRAEVSASANELTDTRIAGGTITEAGLRNNVSVALQYLNSWLLGNGAAAINNLMEDTATAEIARAQLWQWVQRGGRLADGRPVTSSLYTQIRDEELEQLGGASQQCYRTAVDLLNRLVLTDAFVEFLTFPAYNYLE